MQLKKATRKQVKLRMGLSAVSGGGKTYSALKLAFGMVNDWSKIAVIDTENGSASLYSHLGDFNTIDLQAPYTPERYIQAIKACEDAGMELIIIDSITHEWDGKGGMIDISNSMAGNSFTNWAKLTPRHQAFIDSILQSKCHIISCVRRKQDYEMSKDSNGKTTVQKAGLKEITREGYEYELTVNFNLEINHMAIASKDRTGLFMGKPEFVITEDTGRILLDWCNSGEAPLPEFFKTAEEKAQIDPVQSSINILNSSKTQDELKSNWTLIGREMQDNEKCVKAKDEMKVKLTANGVPNS